MTTATLDTRYAGWGSFRMSGATWGVSEDAQRLATFFTDIARDAFVTAAGYSRYGQPIESLFDLYRECARENWDGEGSTGVDQETTSEAASLLFLLPPALPNPTFQPEPSGAIAMEWYKDPKRVLVLSLHGARSIQYAAIMGDGNETHGKVNFSGSLPRSISELLEAFSKI